MTGYLDIDSLLWYDNNARFIYIRMKLIFSLHSEEERVPCTFNLEGSGMGHIDSSNDAEDIPAGSKVDLPLWLGNSLYRFSWSKFQ